MVRFDPTYVEKQISDDELDEILDQWHPTDRPDARSLIVALHLKGWLIGRQYGEPRNEFATQFEDLCFRMGLLIEPFWKIIKHANFSGSFDLIIAIDALEAIEDFMSPWGTGEDDFDERLKLLIDEDYQILDNVLEMDSNSHIAFIGMNADFTSGISNFDGESMDFELIMKSMVEDTVYGITFEYIRQKGFQK